MGGGSLFSIVFIPFFFHNAQFGTKVRIFLGLGTCFKDIFLEVLNIPIVA